MSRFKGIITVSLIALSVLVLTMLSGCGSNQPAQNATPQQQPAATQEKVTIAGSTSVQPFSEIMAEKFMATNKNIKVDVQGGGSGAGIQAAQTGAAQIGSSSRELTAQEKATLKEFIIAKDGIAIIVHPSNTLADLKIEDIRKIFAGQVTNYKQVGGPDKEISLITREAGSGTRSALEEIVMGKEAKISDKAIVQNSTGAVRTAVAADPKAIGYISYASVDKSVKATKVEGVEVGAANIDNGSYKISRPFIYMTKDTPAGAVKAYLDFVLSKEGQDILEKEGLVRAVK
ncbi:MAG: phosphate ABC transporter substrate-binding protein [Firmicutes bacterium]|nr:phosphate ABC transporter substrate-binding protein [Bacillota bacterium]